jgi:peptide/nickel transport system permease protein
MSLERRRHFLYPLPTRKPLPQPWPRGEPGRRPPRSKWVSIAAAIFLGMVVLLSLAAPWMGLVDPMHVDTQAQFQPPSLAHPLGTDLFGRDVWSRLVYGGRLTLGIALLATLVTVLPGAGLGLLAACYGGWPDTLISRLNDVLLTIPYLLLALGAIALWGPGPLNVALAIGLAGLPSTLRVIRAAAVSLRKRPYILAARAVGCTGRRILLRHIFPNVAETILVIATLQAGWAILSVSALTFLGVGVQLGTPEWGAMLNEGRGFLRQAPWIAAGPGLMLTLTVLAVNLLGDGLRDANDPLLR